jgi:hypothetical protein
MALPAKAGSHGFTSFAVPPSWRSGRRFRLVVHDHLPRGSDELAHRLEVHPLARHFGAFRYPRRARSAGRRRAPFSRSRA